MSSNPRFYDRVLESSTTTGTGAYSLDGAVTGYQAFSVVGNGISCYYCAMDVYSDGTPAGGWEIGVGTYTASGTTLSRDSIEASTNGGAAVNWAAGTRRVFVVAPASWFQAGTYSSTTTGNIDDLDFGNAKYIRMNNASLATIRGLKAGLDGQTVTIVSVGSAQVDLAHQNAGNPTAANRLINISAATQMSLAPGTGTATFQYDAATQRWRMITHDQGDYITVPFAAGNYTGNGSMTWIVDPSDQIYVKYKQMGRTLICKASVINSTVGGTASSGLRVAAPAGITFSGNDSFGFAVFSEDGFVTQNVGQAIARIASNTIESKKNTAANWALTTNLTGVIFHVVAETT